MNRFKISPGILVTAGPPSPPESIIYNLFWQAVPGSTGWETQKICLHLENGPLAPQWRVYQGELGTWVYTPIPTIKALAGSSYFPLMGLCLAASARAKEVYVDVNQGQQVRDDWLCPLPKDTPASSSCRLGVPLQAEGLVLRLPPGEPGWRPQLRVAVACDSPAPN